MAQNEKPRVIEIKGLNNMTYDIEEIFAKPGELITIRLTTVTDYKPRQMSHNWVLLKQTINIQAFVDASEKSAINDFIDPLREDEVIAHTGMASAGETVEVTFRAPDRPSKYMYLCTFPGHFFAGMKGTLTVRE
ncbi:MAG: plastocyanin/azurin family copper-binding protein [Balneolaceae bacterium]